ncbi:MAG: Carnitine operon protein CaiE [Alphaproteobacteria bacterium MarineAlpha9_Bin3]|nr:MAG: Carnitine operon protein CaiE [Alphaproteobacteria bacterium MarineAlpha9_Bin3]
MKFNLITYKNFFPKIGKDVVTASTSTVIGNTILDSECILKDRVVLRGDGAEIIIGKGVIFLDRSTVHVASDLMGSYIGDYSIIGRFSLVHACKIGKSVILGDQSIVMDGSEIGDNCIITANSLIPPGKTFPNNSIISGAPAKVIGTIENKSFIKYKSEILNNKCLTGSIVRSDLEGDDPLAELGLEPWINYKVGLERISSRAFIAPDAIIRGNITIKDKASLWFATIVSSLPGGNIFIGEGSNIQDNTIIDSGEKSLVIGKKVTVGHNVRLGACSIGDNCLIGMGCTIEDDVVIEEDAFVGARAIVKTGTIVKANTIYAGRPASYFRDVKTEEANFFQMGQKIYEKFAEDYIKELGTYKVRIH